MLMKKVNLCILLLLGFLLIQSENLLAQDKKFEVKGTVTSADNKPLEGVNVRVVGGKRIRRSGGNWISNHQT